MSDTDRPDGVQLSDSVERALAAGDLIVVSNREPYSHSYEDGSISVSRPTGGLTAGLDPVMRRTDGTWIAWGDGDADFDVVDDDDRVRVPPDDPAYTLKRIPLSDEEVDEYYYGYSNQVLWPLCHELLETATFDATYWNRYREVNDRFAEAVVGTLEEASLVWFQDYHFALAPRLVRDRADAGSMPPMAQFWHIPWPSPETLRACPQWAALLDGLLANDLLAFHVDRYSRNFLRCVERGLDGASVDRDRGRIRYRDNTTRVASYPLGIDADRIDRLARSDEARAFWREFSEEYGIGDRKVAIGVDRLDYTKGIPERIDALERLWESYPEWRGELTYVQKGSESRSEIDAYRDLQQRVDGAIDRVNERFGTDDWQPILTITERLSNAELYGMYANSDVALVTPIRDGMNLVAKEYIAAQTDHDGALVLSELAGVHEELGDAAYTVNPYATDEVARAIHDALSATQSERRRRIDEGRQRVFAYDLFEWMDDVLTAAVTADRTDRQLSSPSHAGG